MKGLNMSAFYIKYRTGDKVGNIINCKCSLAGVDKNFECKAIIKDTIPEGKILIELITNNQDVYFMERIEDKKKRNAIVKILQGPPASGKSTYARQFIEEHGSDRWVIVNRDSIRRSLGDYWIPSREGIVTGIEKTSVQVALENGFSVIIDSTNLNPKTLNMFQELITKSAQENDFNVNIEYKEFNPGFEECLRRDRERKHPVGKSVIRKFFNSYYPEYRKKIDPRVKEPVNYIKNQDSDLLSAVIFDIDGTLSLMNGRDPFIGEDCETDIPNTPIINLLQMHASHGDKIILFSGRNGGSILQTNEWLSSHGIPYDKLIMREEGNYEKDTTLKERFYKEHIEGKYNLKMIYDDRDVVVDMWRTKLNLPCCQVYYGDF